MNEKNYMTDKEIENEKVMPKNERYSYFGSTVVVDGTSYTVIAATPNGKSKENRVRDKLMYLINGKN